MSYIKKYLPFFFFAGILLLLFWKVFFLGQVFYEGDNFHLNIPNKYLLVEQIKNGHLPLWNPYLFLGIPYFADFNIGTLNILNILYFLFPVPRALTFITIFDFFLIGILQYIFLRFLKLPRLPALLGASIFAFSGMPFNLYGNMTYLNVVVYIPLIFTIVFLFEKKRKMWYFLLLILVQTIQFLAGHPQTTYYTMLFVSGYFFFFSIIPFKKRILLLMTYILFPLALSAVQLIPFIEYVMHANRPITNIDYASWGNLTIPGFLTFLFPLLFGNHVDGNWWGPQWILGGFTGVSTLVLLCIGWIKGKFIYKNFSIAGIIFAILLSMGKITTVFYIFYYLIPGWKFFRAPSGLIVFYSFFVSIFAAYGLANLGKKSLIFGKKTWIGFFISGSIAFVSFIMLLLSNQHDFWKHILLWFAHKNVHIAIRLLIYSDQKIASIFSVGFLNVFFFSFFLTLTLLTLLIVKKKILLQIILLVLTLVSLLLPDSKIITSAPIALYSMNLPVPAILQDVQNGTYRVLSLQIDLHQKRENLPGKDYFYREAVGNIGMYKDDNNIERHIYQARGYASLAPASYATFLHSNDPIGVTGVDVTHMTLEQLNETSVKYLIAHEPLPHNRYNHISLLPVASASGKYYIYENIHAIPRASLVDGERVAIILSDPNRIIIAGKTKQPTELILSDWYYPGWQATVNGKETSIKPYLGTFQEVNVPKGKINVIFSYKPQIVYKGFIVTCCSFIIWMLFLILKGKEKIL